MFGYCTLIYILIRGADWLVKRVDGECVLRSEYQSECNTLPHSAAPPRSPSVPITLSVRTGCLCPFSLELLIWPISLLPVRNLPSPFIESERVFRLLSLSPPIPMLSSFTRPWTYSPSKNSSIRMLLMTRPAHLRMAINPQPLRISITNWTPFSNPLLQL